MKMKPKWFFNIIKFTLSVGYIGIVGFFWTKPLDKGYYLVSDIFISLFFSALFTLAYIVVYVTILMEENGK